MKQKSEPLFDAIVRIDKLPAGGRAVSVDADEQTRASIATVLKLGSVERFTAELRVVPLRGGLRAQGHLEARITQPSVVSFEPVPQDVSEVIDRVFLPASAVEPAAGPGSEVFVDLEDEDFPDHIDGAEVDLSDLLIETLALAIDPYPRLPGEDLNALGLTGQDETAGPFAALARLKDNGET